MLTRRELLLGAGRAVLAGAPLLKSMNLNRPTLRCVNLVNFLRENEPRFVMDMMEAPTNQMALIKKRGYPATWLLQFDALVAGPFVDFLKAEMPAEHEVGFWFEMNKKHCEAAGVEWRGRPGYDWDYHPDVAFTIGYTPEERVRLADTAVAEFERVWGHPPRSVASWNLDAITIRHLVERHGVDGFAVCRDQVATDGFTIWGAPIAGYYPSKLNAWSPAVHRNAQIDAPVLRMLGQDPVYGYDSRVPDGKGGYGASLVTMEPAWGAGQNRTFVGHFLERLARDDGGFAYAQLGQENTFPWPQQAEAYAMQLEVLERFRGELHIETMNQTARRFREAFDHTPVQTQFAMLDPFGATRPDQTSFWFQSRFYRANLHWVGDEPYFRDLKLYTDALPQPYLREPTRLKDVEQRVPSVVDGVFGKGRAWLSVGGQRLRGPGSLVQQTDARTEVRIEGLTLAFDEHQIVLRGRRPAIEFEAESSPLVSVEPGVAHFRELDLDYRVEIRGGVASRTDRGWKAEGARVLRLRPSC